ncbi:hypothetical protein N658DRAFT_47331 [Parathielavia hyrcaniae]|uniref:C2H2-type domain-containing protein n=1 Tax=Parathielavia hyrcaniae TaxID=113614 RepID=A0AAN6PQM7_9PEZI|nr:hypothetical protein N658DRAFT_47331 [Parathielavia hyrcaniae]
MMLQGTAAASPSRPINLAPTTVDGRIPSIVRSVPVGGIMSQPWINSLYSQGPLMPRASMMPGSDPPTCGVGLQCGSGILPSILWTPAAPTAGATQTENQVDAEGKFPCAHYDKICLAIKNLMRHLTNHTSVQPYMCILCHDTFSRSDALSYMPWIAYPSCQSKNVDSYLGWAAFYLDSVSGHSGDRSVGLL